MDVEGSLPEELRRTRFVGEMVPGIHTELGLTAGSNCQRYAYAVLSHFGRALPALRSAELWADDAYTEPVARPEPLDLVLYAADSDAFGAHVGLWLGDERILHLCEEVGTPVVWRQEDFDARERYRTRIGFKRVRPLIEHNYDAAGGVVIDSDRVLVLDRPSREEVRLPKGHVEPGETQAEAAVREVGEEAGYPDVVVARDLGVVGVEFMAFPPEGPGHHIVRREHYFRMELVSARTAGRSEPDHKFTPRWAPIDSVLDQMTFDNEREWVRRAINDLDA